MRSFLRGEQHLLSVIRLKIKQDFENFPVSSCFSHCLVQEIYKHTQKALHCEIMLFQWWCVVLMGVRPDPSSQQMIFIFVFRSLRFLKRIQVTLFAF